MKDPLNWLWWTLLVLTIAFFVFIVSAMAATSIQLWREALA